MSGRRIALGGAAVLLVGGVGWWLASTGGGAPPLDRAARVPADRDEASGFEPFAAPVDVADPVVATRNEEARDASGAPESPDEEAAAAAGPRELLLHVRDRANGVELDECEARLARSIASTLWMGGDDPIHDGYLAPFARGRSPLRLVAPPDRQALDDLLVVAPGHAPAKLQIDWKSGGERTIELAPAADLEIVVHNVPPGVKAHVLLRDAGRCEEHLRQMLRHQDRISVRSAEPHARSRKAVEQELAWLRDGSRSRVDDLLLRRLIHRGIDRFAQLDADGRTTVSSLAAARWLVVVESPDRGTKPSTCHAAGEVVLRAGESKTLELAWSDPVERPRFHVTGRVLFDRGWFDTDMPELPARMRVGTLDIDEPGAANPYRGWLVPLEPGNRREERRFDAGYLPPGAAVACLEDWRWTSLFVVSEGDSESLAIVVPPPVRVSLRARRRDAPDIDVPFEFQWEGFDDPGAAQGAFLEQGMRSDDAQPVELVVPRGWLSLWAGACFSDQKLESRHRVDRGFEEIALELREPARVVVTLRDGRAIVPFGGAFFAAWLEANGRPLDAVSRSFSGGSPSLTLTVDAEGPALVHLDPFDCYAMVAPVDVELVRGKSLAVDLPIERAGR